MEQVTDNYTHHQKEVRLKNGIVICKCDEKLVSIIRALNEHGCTTEMSCQNINGEVWICFALGGGLTFCRLASKVKPNITYKWRWTYKWGGIRRETLDVRLSVKELPELRELIRKTFKLNRNLR